MAVPGCRQRLSRLSLLIMDHCPPAAGDHTAFALQARAAETRIDSAAGCSLQQGEKGVPSIGLEQVCVLSSTINAATCAGNGRLGRGPALLL